MDTINWLSIAISTLLPLALGLIYFRWLFGKAWLDTTVLANRKMTTIHKILAVLLVLLLSFFLSIFFLNFNNSGINQEGDFDNFGHGAWHGTFVAITVVVPVVVLNGIVTKQSWKTVLIIVLYWIMTLALMGGVLDAMNHWENIMIPETR